MAERTTTKTKAAAAKKPATRRTPRKAAQEAAAAAQAMEQKMKNSHLGGFADFFFCAARQGGTSGKTQGAGTDERFYSCGTSHLPPWFIIFRLRSRLVPLP